MEDVFEHSYLTIAAAYSQDDTGGLFFAIDPGTAYPFGICVQNVPGQGKGYLCFNHSDWYDSVGKAPLNTRAWVLQERLLSRRLLHFTGQRVYWQCRSDFGPKNAMNVPSLSYGLSWQHWDNDLALSVMKSPTRTSETQAQFVVEQWAKIVEAYSELALTFDTDRLVAVSGLARRFAKNSFMMPDDCLAGLWRPHLSRLLLWCYNSSKDISHKSNVAPSWSWASTLAQITYTTLSGDQSQADSFHILAASAETQEDPFGQVSSGRLLVRGELVLSSSFADEDLPASQPGMSTCLYDTRKDRDDASHVQVLFLFVKEWEGLMLCRLAGTRTLRRLGYWKNETPPQRKTSSDRDAMNPSSYHEAHEDGIYTIEIV